LPSKEPAPVATIPGCALSAADEDIDRNAETDESSDRPGWPELNEELFFNVDAVGGLPAGFAAPVFLIELS
jgi:hypothetical protein